MSKTLIWDNGANTIKIGFISDQQPRIIPNCVVKAKSERKRVYVGDELNECRDHSSLFFLLPAEKGYIVNWDIQQKIWDRIIGKDVFDVTPSDTKLVLTDPIYNVPAIKDFSYEILFEHHSFHSVAKTSATSLVALADTVSSQYGNEFCCIIVDSGYSFTHIVPYYKGKAVRSAIVRIDIGGKALTNLLKEWVSYRQLNVLEETYVMNECKEDVCYVADDFQRHMDIAKRHGKENSIIREYVLPDFVSHHRGFICEPSNCNKENNQKLTVNVERFAAPEALFNPSDVGIHQMGIPEALAYSVSLCPEAMRGRLFNNIILIGGNSLFAGYQRRLSLELRSHVDDIYNIGFRDVPNPITHAWQCGRDAFCANVSKDRFVTKEEYNEYGIDICIKRYFKFFED